MSDHPSDRLSAYLDGELAAVERSAVEAHLQHCISCAAALQRLVQIDALAREATIAAPEGYFDDLPARITRRLRLREAPIAPVIPVPATRTRTIPAWSYAVAATLLAAVFAPIVLRNSAPVQVARPPVPATAPSNAAPAPSEAAAANETAGIAPTLRSQEPAGVPNARTRRPSAEPAEPKAVADGARASDFAPPPPQAQATTSLEEDAATRQRDETEARVAAPSLAAARALPRSEGLRKAQPYAVSKARYEALAARTAVTPGEIRALRDEWRSFITDNGTSDKLGEAWLQVIDLGIRLAEESGAETDWDRVRHDAAQARLSLSVDPARQARILELLSRARKER